MKRILQVLAVSISLLAASFALAGNVAGYSSAQVSVDVNKVAASKALNLPPTAINVVNLSQDRIYIEEPVTYEIPEGTARSVLHQTYSGYTRIVLTSWDHRVIFDQSVCHYAIVSVGRGYVKVDTERC